MTLAANERLGMTAQSLRHARIQKVLSTLISFLGERGSKDYQKRAMAFRWRAVNGPPLSADLAAL